MNEYEVTLTNEKAFVIADYWTEQNGVVYFWIGSSLVKSFGNAISVKSKYGVHLIKKGET